MTGTAPDLDVRRAAGVVWRALVLCWVLGVVLALVTGAGGLGVGLVSYAVVLGAVPVLVVGGTGAMLVEHRLVDAGPAHRAAVYGALGAGVALLAGLVVLQAGVASWWGFVLASVGAASAAGACVWAAWSRGRGGQ